VKKSRKQIFFSILSVQAMTFCGEYRKNIAICATLAVTSYLLNVKKHRSKYLPICPNRFFCQPPAK
jgi:hypothetical protein